MESDNVITLIGAILVFLATIISLISAGKVRSLVLKADEQFRQSGEVNVKALESIQEINYCLRKVKEVFVTIHLKLYLIKEKNIQCVIDELNPTIHKFHDNFIDSYSRGEMFLSKSLRKELDQIDYSIRHPSDKEDKLKKLIADLEMASDKICDLAKDIYFPLAKNIIDK